MTPVSMKVMRVYFSRDYLIPEHEDAKELYDDWFRHTHPDNYHAYRDGSLIHGRTQTFAMSVLDAVEEHKRIESELRTLKMERICDAAFPH